MSPFDAEELLAGLEIPGWVDTVQADMASANWQQKADAVTAIGQRIEVRLIIYVCVCALSHVNCLSINHFCPLTSFPPFLPPSPCPSSLPPFHFPSPSTTGHGGWWPILSSPCGVPVLQDIVIQNQQYQHNEGSHPNSLSSSETHRHRSVQQASRLGAHQKLR
jgi:hypothetical protein